MAHTDKTLLLDTISWEPILDADGNLRMITGSHAIAQNCANEIRRWKYDTYFQREKGIAYQEALLAQKIDESLFKQLIRETCLDVPGVVSADEVEIVLFDRETRTLHGSVEITTIYNETVAVAF